MGNNNTIEIIIKDIEELEKTVSNLKNYSRIPGIELDLVLGKMQNIYELMLMLKDGEGNSLENTEAEMDVPPSHEDIKTDNKEDDRAVADKNIISQENALAESQEKESSSSENEEEEIPTEKGKIR